RSLTMCRYPRSTYTSSTSAPMRLPRWRAVSADEPPLPRPGAVGSGAQQRDQAADDAGREPEHPAECEQGEEDDAEDETPFAHLIVSGTVAFRPAAGHMPGDDADDGADEVEADEGRQARHERDDAEHLARILLGALFGGRGVGRRVGSRGLGREGLTRLVMPAMRIESGAGVRGGGCAHGAWSPLCWVLSPA